MKISEIRYYWNSSNERNYGVTNFQKYEKEKN